MAEKRAVCLNCIDGRVQLPVIEWIKDNYGALHVDMITEPGMDGYLADYDNPIDDIIRKAKVSIDKNGASVLFLAGHHDCKGNSVEEAIHKEHIKKSAERIKSEIAGVEIIGIWVNDKWIIEIVK